ncbi:hypothetical protein OsJ_16933 [Oryza sativa Japonica Group]|uniref:Uncharacterized protein n=1 Tax=Oryza sativa subsp. japonica TaxID=39947 RepID=B9FM71_ORYSJ|nr:hypothetical protein OsJ_16933 [Oryza sativa Japonica Group]
MEAMQQRRRGSNAKAIGPSRGHLPRVVTCPRAVPGVEEEDGGVGGRYPGVEEENGGGFPRGSEPELKKKKTEVGFLRSRRLELKKMETGPSNDEEVVKVVSMAFVANNSPLL